jgi:preprotein translocase subunit SecE
MAKQNVQVSKPNFFRRSRTYLNEVRIELAKVTWPSQSELKASTTVVLIFLVILATAIGTMDIIFQRAVLLLYNLT